MSSSVTEYLKHVKNVVGPNYKSLSHSTYLSSLERRNKHPE